MTLSRLTAAFAVVLALLALPKRKHRRRARTVSECLPAL